MTSRLASLLVQEGLVAPKQMADAFQRQVIYGGALDTILLEMNALPEQDLVGALARASALPSGGPPGVEALRAAGALEWFTAALAERYRAVPIGVEGQIVRVLTTDPPDRRALDELGLQLGRAIEATIALEYRFVHALSTVYETPIPARFQSLQARLRRRAEQAAGGAPSPPPSPRSVITDFPVAAPGPAAPASPHDQVETPRLTTREVAAPSPIPREVAAAISTTPPPGPSPEAMPMAAALQAIDSASDRDEIFAALCRGARSRAHYVALFTVHADMMAGRLALADAWIDRAALSTVSLSLEAATPFRTAATGRAPLVGRVGEDDASRALLRALGREAPVQAAIVPIVLRERTVALLYADASGKGIAGATMGELANATAAASRAFQRLILSAKGRDFRPAPAAPTPAAKLDVASVAAPAPQAISPAPAAEVALTPPAPADDALPIDDTTPEPPVEGGWRVGIHADAGRLAPIHEAETARHVAPQPALDVDALFHSIERGDDMARFSADQLIAYGPQAAKMAVARMPGPIRIDRHGYRGVTPPLADHGPLLALISRFGEVVAPALERRLGENNADVRYYATLALGELGGAGRLPYVAARLFDRDGTVRKVAVDAIERHPSSPQRTAIVESLRGELPGPDLDRQWMAAEALGVLGDAASVPRLIELVKHADVVVQTAARRALAHITKQDYGTSRWRWRGWWERHKNESRTDWLFEGLAHSDDEIRAAAAEELKRFYPDSFGYNWDAPKREREDARKRWLERYRQRR